MKVELIHNTPLWVASKAIRKCWASEDKSDTEFTYETDRFDTCEKVECGEHTNFYMGTKDKELIHRVGNKNKHSSTLEHLNYTFDIDGVSRALLQEVARHRHASISVKSTRYTLKELKEEEPFEIYAGNTYNRTRDEEAERVSKYCVRATEYLDEAVAHASMLNEIIDLLNDGMSNDKVKYLLPEAYKTSYIWTINARSLQNFLSLRTNKSALWEIRDLAYEIYKQLPEEHKYMFTEFLYEEK